VDLSIDDQKRLAQFDVYLPNTSAIYCKAACPKAQLI